MDIDLKPCPFCGFDEARIITIRDGRMVNCHNCHASGPAYYHGVQGISATPALAAGKWNQRDTAEVLRLTARITQLEAAVEAERERCAKIAESPNTPVFKTGWSTAQDAAAISTMRSIATAIRTGAKP